MALRFCTRADEFKGGVVCMPISSVFVGGEKVSQLEVFEERDVIVWDGE